MRFKQFLNEANVANTKQAEKIITKWLGERGNTNQFVKKWFLTTAKKYFFNNEIDELINATDIKKDTNNPYLAAGMFKDFRDIVDPAYANKWEKDIEDGKDVYFFPELGGHHMRSLHLLDYFNAVPPTRDIKMTFPQAEKTAEKYFESIRKKASEKIHKEGISLMKKYSDGAYWCKIISDEELKREGKLMNHCVGSYSIRYAGTQIYSYRTKNDVPHITIEVTNEEIRQIKGHSNGVPKIEYHKAIFDMLKILSNSFDINTFDVSREMKLPLVFDDKEKEFYDVFKLPTNKNLWLAWHDNWFSYESKLLEFPANTTFFNAFTSEFESYHKKFPIIFGKNTTFKNDSEFHRKRIIFSDVIFEDNATFKDCQLSFEGSISGSRDLDIYGGSVDFRNNINSTSLNVYLFLDDGLLFFNENSTITVKSITIECGIIMFPKLLKAEKIIIEDTASSMIIKNLKADKIVLDNNHEMEDIQNIKAKKLVCRNKNRSVHIFEKLKNHCKTYEEIDNRVAFYEVNVP